MIYGHHILIFLSVRGPTKDFRRQDLSRSPHSKGQMYSIVPQQYQHQTYDVPDRSILKSSEIIHNITSMHFCYHHGQKVQSYLARRESYLENSHWSRGRGGGVGGTPIPY